jgi:hypothetical protein
MSKVRDIHRPLAGRHGKAFHIFKFHTMYERPESYQGAKITAEDDLRITPVGNPRRGQAGCVPHTLLALIRPITDSLWLTA